MLGPTDPAGPPGELEAGPALTKVVSRPVRVKPRSLAPSTQKLAGTTKPNSQALPTEAGEPAAPVPAPPTKPSKPQPPQPRTAPVVSGRAYPTAKPSSARPSGEKTPSSDQEPGDKPPPVELPAQPRGWGAPTPQASPSGSGEGGTQSNVTRRAMPISQPEFNLSDRFPELKSVKVKAEFKINKDGSYEPTLMSGSGNPTADVVILAKLLEYKWLPALDKGVPIEDVRVLQIRLDG